MRTQLGLMAVLLTCGTVTASAQERDDWRLHPRMHREWRWRSNPERLERMRVFREHDRMMNRRMTWSYDRLRRFDRDQWHGRDSYRERFGPYRMQPRSDWRDDFRPEWRQQMRDEWPHRRYRSGRI
jgi:hypothetical protein